MNAAATEAGTDAQTAAATAAGASQGSLLESILLLLSAEEREQFLAAAGASGVVYANRSPTFTKPLAVRLSATAFALLKALVVASDPRAPRGLYSGFKAAFWAARGRGQFIELADYLAERVPAESCEQLRADFALWTKVLDKGTPQARVTGQRTLGNWLKAPELASVRDQDALAKLPEREREAWSKLWAEVVQLLPPAPKDK
jgi:hypothetical protein